MKPFGSTPRHSRVTPLKRTVVIGAILAAALAPAFAESDVSYGQLINRLAVGINPVTHKAYAVNESAGTISVTDEKFPPIPFE